MKRFQVYILFATPLIHSSKRCDCFISLDSPFFQVSKRSFLHLTALSSAESNGDDWVTDLSDEEALLACRAYLQRKNRLVWLKAKDRKEKRQEMEGFGWGEEGEEYSIGEEDDDNEEEKNSLPRITYEDIDIEEEELGGFRSMPTGPSEKSAVRSKIKKQQFKDPTFRERWYHARWGGHTKQTPEEKRKELIHSKFGSVPASVWASPEFGDLTDEEIQIAITTYVNSNKKRSEKLKKSPQERPSLKEELRAEGEDQKLDRDMLFTPSEELLREKQRERYLIGKLRYEKRKGTLKEVKQASTEASRLMSKRGRRPTGSSPQDAMARIITDLDAGNQPSRQDVEKLMEPKKLSRRKDILKRILKEHFKLRGKCIPNSEGGMSFLTNTPVPKLGEFILELLSKQETEKKD